LTKNSKHWLQIAADVCYTCDMSVTWRRQKGKYHDTRGWDLLIDNIRVGCVVQQRDDSVTVIFRGKHYVKSYSTISGARMQLERLAEVETDWARSRRAKMPSPLTPEELTWKLLNQ
jgi:hypothetical protein